MKLLTLFSAAAICAACANPDSSYLSSETNTKKTPRVAYVEINNYDIEAVNTYEEAGSPVFDIAIMFAANIRGKDGKADLYFNPKYKEQLIAKKGQISAVRSAGTKVLMSVLNDHQDAGWSCFRNYQDAKEFALELKTAVENYQLDGIEIDDEYDKCKRKYEDSLAMVTTAIKRVMPDKLLVKSLWSDLDYFKANYQGNTLGQNLDMGWEMTYGTDCKSRADRYLDYLDRKKLGVGASTLIDDKESARAVHQCVIDNNYGGGFMVFNLSEKNQEWLTYALSIEE